MANNNSKKVPNVPALRFPGFSGEWERVQIEDVVRATKGTSYAKSDIDNKGKIPLILYGELYTDFKDQTIINESLLKTSSIYNGPESEEGDVICPCSGETPYEISNACAVMKSGIRYGGDITIMKPKKGIFGPFMAYSLRGPLKKRIYEIAQGDSVVHLSFENLKKLELSFPSVAEQVKIANLLETIEKRIEVQRKIIKDLKCLLIGLNDTLWECCYKDTYSFGKIASVYGGLQGKSAVDFIKGNDYYISYLNVYNNRVVDCSKFETVKVSSSEKQNQVSYGDLLLTISSETPKEVGICSVYLGNDHPYLNSFCIGLKVNAKNVLVPEYMPYLFSTRAFRKHIFPYAQGSTRYNLAISSFLKSNFSWPSIKEQRKIANFLNLIESKIKTTVLQLNHLIALKCFSISVLFPSK